MCACRLPSSAQILPKENSELNYRLIGFMCEKEKAGVNYKIEIAAGSYSDVDSFSAHIIQTVSGASNKLLHKVPAFGSAYTWRSVATLTDSTVVISRLHHFNTLASRIADTAATRVRITANNGKYDSFYVMMDGTRGLYDMSGELIWFLPSIENRAALTFDNFGDLKVSPQGTVTFITNRTGGQIYEVDYNGNMLWKGPDNGVVSGDSSEHYHHEFTRLGNGHYMALGSEGVSWKLPGIVDSGFLKKPHNQKKIYWNDTARAYYERMQFGTIIEYDTAGKVVWSWKSSKYFKDADVFSRTAPHGAYYVSDVHTNGFYFDRKAGAVYVSFKGISRVIKLRYPAGNVTGIFGKKHDHGNVKGYGPDLFVQQHNCMISKEGYLYLFNNNARYAGAMPTLVMMKMPVTPKDTLRKVWEYTCTVDNAITDRTEFSFSSGGNVTQMPDGSMFACMSGPEYTKVFIVNKQKEVLWSAMPEAKNRASGKWSAIVQYRASIISRNELERLIWSQQ